MRDGVSHFADTKRAKVLKPWYGCGVSETCILSNVYIEFSDGKSIGGLPIPEEYLGTARLKRLQAQRGQNVATRVSCECTVGDAIAALGQYIEYSVSRILNGDC